MRSLSADPSSGPSGPMAERSPATTQAHLPTDFSIILRSPDYGGPYFLSCNEKATSVRKGARKSLFNRWPRFARVDTWSHSAVFLSTCRVYMQESKIRRLRCECDKILAYRTFDIFDPSQFFGSKKAQGLLRGLRKMFLERKKMLCTLQ
ncbi:hypothetical protein CDAR_209591 [Caerostris darwini]|uniref:Uncharacterized protein n=1 Tax=Caerostris darwini TaxID=1538125 RepID=A0AAV4SXQ4_9ARAC|nr:hypothetical protein CDAR_209591 [Caerostris darwini]